MADNQQSGSTSQGGGQSQQNQQKSQLSWGQPSNTNHPAQGNASSKSSNAAATAASSSSSRSIGIFVAGLVIGLLIAWAWFDLRGSSGSGTSAMSSSTNEFAITQTQQPGQTSTGSAVSSTQNTGSATQTTQTAAPASVTANATLAVPSPQAAGSSVQVSSISAGQSVWAVVYEDNNGSLGRVLGAARFADRTSGAIGLLRSTLPNLKYFVVLVADTSDHSYNLNVNAPIVGSDGKQVMAEFTAQ